MKPISRIALILIFAAAMLSVSSAQAQVLRRAMDRHQNRQDVRRDEASVVYEVAHLDRLSDLVIQWNELREAGAGREEIAQVLDSIAVEVRWDLAGTAVQARQAGRETRQAARELRQDRREVREDRRDVQEASQLGAPVEVAAATHELREDRRERRDDRRDLRENARDKKQSDEILQGKRAIAKELVELQGQIDRAAVPSEPLRAKQAALLDKYLELSKKEIALGIREVRKDRREIREDRRETREDRMEGQH